MKARALYRWLRTPLANRSGKGRRVCDVLQTNHVTRTAAGRGLQRFRPGTDIAALSMGMRRPAGRTDHGVPPVAMRSHAPIDRSPRSPAVRSKSACGVISGRRSVGRTSHPT